jgi:serine/threonine protein kinase
VSDVRLGLPGLDEVEEIGRGGFGVVYRARQQALNRMVAVKVLGAGLDEADRERVAREAWAMGTLSGHPNIVNVFDVGVTPAGAQYITMSYVAQGSLAARIGNEGALPWTEAVRITIKLAGAVEMAHRAGTLHRDIKPENVLMSDYGEPQLADFGIARVEGRFEKATGQFTASVVHAAPEVLDGNAADVAADVYSMGSTLFTMLSGGPAFTRRPDETLAALFIRIVRDPLPDLRLRGVPDAVCRVVEHAMAKDPRQRPASAAELGRLLQDVQRRAGLPATDMAGLRPRRPGCGGGCRRRGDPARGRRRRRPRVAAGVVHHCPPPARPRRRRPGRHRSDGGGRRSPDRAHLRGQLGLVERHRPGGRQPGRGSDGHPPFTAVGHRREPADGPGVRHDGRVGRHRHRHGHQLGHRHRAAPVETMGHRHQPPGQPRLRRHVRRFGGGDRR